jgi:UDP-N-acetylglucosamine/UDP-N-acetylgalactosamine diphosphorylase
MDPLKNELLATLTPCGQEQLLRFWDSLDAGQRESLAGEIRSIDFRLVAELYRRADSKAAMRALAARGTSPPAFALGDPRNRISPEAARQQGVEALRTGHVGVMLVAGGQGTRLGFKHPKGMFPIGPVSGKSLFQIHFEKVCAVSRRYGVRIPLYLMTSPETHEETVSYLRGHERFGFPADDLCVFRQGTMPAVDAQTGKVLLAGGHHVALSPDGHGGTLAALERSGAMADAGRRAVRHLFYFQVDNPLVSVCDPEFLGYHLLSGSEFTSQVVRKQEPAEKVGNVVQVDGRLHVIEYSDLPDDVAVRRAADGSLDIWAGSIAVHAMEFSFLERMLQAAGGLPFHRASKKVAHLDDQGILVEPAQPNAVKFERFIFDLMPSAQRAIVVEVDPARHSAPLKNASGQPRDTRESVQSQMSALHREWLRRAGFDVADDVPVEISPMFALDAEEFGERMLSRKAITQPTYFG